MYPLFCFDIKVFCLLPTGNRQENAPKKLTTTSLSFGDSVHVQMFLSVLFTDDFLSSSVLKLKELCQFLSISRREEIDICNCQQPCQQSALPTEVLPLDEGAEIQRHAHYLPAPKNAYCPSEARRSGEGDSAVKISEPKTSGWIDKCASINMTADKQNKIEKEKSTSK